MVSLASGLSRRTVLRFAVRRLAARQALRDRRRRRVSPSFGLDTTACVLVGMGALSAAIVGGPLTMTFLVLESTGNLGVAGGVLAASIATTLAVRATFGYSFTTWRLHLRGETIRGGQDVGWLRELTVGRMMVPSPPVFPAERASARFAKLIHSAAPMSSSRSARTGVTRGSIYVPEAHAAVDREGRRRRHNRRRHASAGDCVASGRRRPHGARPVRRRRDRHARRRRTRDRPSARARSTRPTPRAVTPRRRIWR